MGNIKFESLLRKEYFINVIKVMNNSKKKKKTITGLKMTSLFLSQLSRCLRKTPKDWELIVCP